MKHLIASLIIATQLVAPLVCCCAFASMAPPTAPTDDAVSACHQPASPPACHNQAPQSTALESDCNCDPLITELEQVVMPAVERLDDIPIPVLPPAPMLRTAQVFAPSTMVLRSAYRSPPYWLTPHTSELNVYRL